MEENYNFSTWEFNWTVKRSEREVSWRNWRSEREVRWRNWQKIHCRQHLPLQWTTDLRYWRGAWQGVWSTEEEQTGPSAERNTCNRDHVTLWHITSHTLTPWSAGRSWRRPWLQCADKEGQISVCWGTRDPHSDCTPLGSAEICCLCGTPPSWWRALGRRSERDSFLLYCMFSFIEKGSQRQYLLGWEVGRRNCHWTRVVFSSNISCWTHVTS